MTSIQSVLLILLVVVIAAVLLWLWFRSHTYKQATKQAARLARQVFPTWAAQGPFKSGEESKAAMHYAYLAVMGPEEAERMGVAGTFANHASAYDSDPTTWERTRQMALQAAGAEIVKFVTIAKGLAAMDDLNKDLLEAGGHKLALARQPDGSLGIAYKKIWSDEKIKGKKEQDNEAIVLGIGKGLLNDPSEEARALVAFLADTYKTNVGKKALSASAIGRAWLACLAIKNEEPESELAQRFEKLTEAHQAIRESVEDTLEWSSNPGAHEAHLIRRHNNPYFPESRRRVLKEELSKAKRMDNDGYILCEQRLAQFLEEDIEGLPSALIIADLHKLRERLDGLILFSMGVGGPAKEVVSKANKLRDAVISDMRAACSNDKEALENIEKADSYHMDNTRKFYIPVMAQIVSKRSPIPKEETIAAILSEEPESIAIFMNSLQENDRPKIRLGALKLMQEVLHHGHIDPKFEEKVSALEGKWPFLAIGGADFDEGLAAAQRGDYAAAMREWRPLAEKDDATAQYNLGIMYENGWGVPKDPTQAVQWYREAAKSGNTRFIFHLASMYSLGKGVPTDFVRAYMFFSIAAEMGDIDGVKSRDLHAKAMTSAQITKAKMLAQEWRMKSLHKK